MPAFRSRRRYRLGRYRVRPGMRRRRLFGVRRYSRMRPWFLRRAVRAAPTYKTYVDATIADASIDVAGTVAIIDTGVTGPLRLESLYWRCTLTSSATTQVTPNIRVLLLMDTRVEDPAALPAVTDILQTATFLSPLAAASGIGASNKGRFTVLSDRVFTMGTGANVADAAGTGVPVVQKRFYKQFINLRGKRQYSDQTPDTTKNKLLCLFISDEDEIGSISAIARIGFTRIATP